MMGRYLVIIRCVISTICIVLLLWGCERTTVAPAKPKVVRKKIIVQKDSIAKSYMKKTVGAAGAIEVAKSEQKTATAAVEKPPIVLKKIPDVKTGKDQLPLAKSYVKKTVSAAGAIEVAKSEQKTATAAVEKPPVVLKKIPDVKTGKDQQPLIAKKAVATPTRKVESKKPMPKKPAIKPLSDISKIKQPVKIQKPTLGDKLIAATSGQIQTVGPPAKQTDYDPVGKIDPFEPLFKEKPVSVKKKKRKKRIPRTPLERIDLSQLTLVGIILTSSGNMALVEEASGKGYVVKKGTYIGTNAGKISKINKEKVIVEEEFEDVFGKVKIRKREIKLPKPPGEF